MIDTSIPWIFFFKCNRDLEIPDIEIDYKRILVETKFSFKNFQNFERSRFELSQLQLVLLFFRKCENIEFSHLTKV